MNEKRWWARLSKSKESILKRLLNNEALAPLFCRVLLDIPGMQNGFQIGNMAEVIASRDFEVCGNLILNDSGADD